MEVNMDSYVADIEKITLVNSNFREVVFTGTYCQLVVMSLKPGEEIGLEVHGAVDQFFRVEEGMGKVIINGIENQIKAGFAIVVPAGSEHNVVNDSPNSDLKLYTIYSPPQHKDGIIHKTKQDAMADETDHL